MAASWFWHNYDICRRWQNMHKIVEMEVVNMSKEFEKCHLSNSHSPINCSTGRKIDNYEYCDINLHEDNEMDDTIIDDPITLIEQETVACDYEESDYSTDDSELTFEVTQEVLDFLEQSMKHKLELQKQRELESGCVLDDTDEKKSKTKTKGKNRNFEDVKTLTDAPTCPVGKLRLEEMSLLYGDAAPKIHGMETALQLSFNMKCDAAKPTLWPSIPFNFRV